MNDDRKQISIIVVAGAILGLVLALIVARLFGDDGRDDGEGDKPKPKVPPSLEVLAEGQRRKKAKIERGGFKPKLKKEEAPEPVPASA